MSVVEFSADAWQAASPGLQGGLANRIEAVGDLLQGLDALAASGNVSGAGADGMRAYVREVHVPILQSLLIALSTFQTAVGVYWDGYAQVDADGNFRLVKDEYDAHLSQLESGMGQLRGFGAQLRQIAADASHLVSLGGAGAAAAEQTADDLQQMHSIAKGQKEAWEAFEASDPGFGQVQNLIAELSRIVKNVGSLTVGRGRTYTAGSFSLTLQQLGELTSGMLTYCEQNQKVATAGWEAMFSGYAEDVEAARREQAGWDLLWDALQIAAGAVITVIGLGLTPFTGGFSLGLTVLGGSLLIGGVNNAINHVSIATTGQELNLVGMAAEAIGQWYDVNVAQPAADSGSWGLQFLAGVGSGLGQALNEAAQLNVHEIGLSLQSLVLDEGARSALWNQLTTTVGQVFAGNAFVIGQLAGNVLLPGAAATKLSRAGSVLNKASKLPGLVKQPPIITTPSLATTALNLAKGWAGTAGAKIRNVFDPAVKPAWKPHPDNPPKPGDAHYGQPMAEHGVHSPYPPVTDINRRTFELVSDPDAPWGRGPAGKAYSKLEYDERFTLPKTDPVTGKHWDDYPPNDGAVPGSRRDYDDLAAYVREHGNDLDRIGKETGNYLGVMEGGRPATFEQRGLPVNSLELPYYSYRLADSWPPGIENWTIEYSKIAPAFGRPGGGYQLLIRDQEGVIVPVKELLEAKVLIPEGAVS